MTLPCLFIEDDLSHAVLSIAGRCEVWRAPASDRGAGASTDEPNLAQATLARAANLAAWARERLGRGQAVRLCAGVKRAVCERVRAPSASPTVVAAALAQRDEEAADRLAALTIEPIRSPAPAQAPGAEQDDQQRKPARLTALRAFLDRKGDQARADAAITVIETPTAGVRLAMDALERAGRPVHEAITLWHALLLAHPPAGESAVAPPSVNGEAGSPARGGQAAIAAAAPQQTRAVVQMDSEGGVVWAWGRGRTLLTGGSLAPRRSPSTSSGSRLGARPELHQASDESAAPAVAPPADASSSPATDLACSRLLLDWLSWSAQLELAPAQITVVGPTAVELSMRLKQAWPDAVVQPVESADPPLETLGRLTAPGGPSLAAGAAADADTQEADASVAPSTPPPPALASTDASPPSRFEALTRRPSRRSRRAGLWWGAAMTLVAAAGAIDGGRSLLASGSLGVQAQEARSQVRDRALELGLTAAETRAPVRSLLGRVQVAQQEFKPPAPPPPPRPIREEIARLAAAVATVEGARLERVSLESRTGGLATITVPSLEVGERVQLAIRQSQGQVRWTSQFVGRAPAFTLRLTPSWETFQ